MTMVGSEKEVAEKIPQQHNIMLTLSYVILFGIWAMSYWYAMPMGPNVVLTATLIIYIGSHRSLRLLATEAEGGLAAKDKEVMTTKDAA